MTTPDDKFKPRKRPTRYSSELEPWRFDKLNSAWAQDRLAILGVGSAAIAFLLWAVPDCPYPNFCSDWFPDERLPAVAAFLALSFILLLLRRR
jgi:hypothetical protein